MLNIVEYKDKHKIDIGSYIKVKRELVKFSAVNMKEIGSNPIHITKRVNARKNNGGYVFSNETRKKMSDAKLGKTMSTLTKEKISKSNKGKPKSPEHNKKVSDALTGRTHNIETRKKISDAKIGKANGSLNPAANKISIFNKNGVLMFKCNGNFFKICNEHKLPKALMNSYKNNGAPIYSGKTIKNEVLRKYGKFKGWYAVMEPREPRMSF